MTAYYKNFNSIKSIENVRSIFPEGKADENNWCVFSTSGVHGTYTDLVVIERYYANPEKFVQEENGGEQYTPSLTVLVIRPRIVSMLYGHVSVGKDDVPYLRTLANSSLEAIKNSQVGNV